MDEAKKVKIEQLAATAYDKHERYSMMRMMNTPTEPAAKKQSAIELAVACGEMIEARRALEDTLNEICRTERAKRFCQEIGCSGISLEMCLNQPLDCEIVRKMGI